MPVFLIVLVFCFFFSIVKAEGIETYMMSIVSESLNFSWSMVTPSDGNYGILQSDNETILGGMIGEVCKLTEWCSYEYNQISLLQNSPFTASGLADFSYCNMWVGTERNNFVDFSYSFLQRCITFLVPRPRIISYQWYSIFLGFSIEIWMSILFLMFLNIFFLYILSKIYDTWMAVKIEIQQIVMDFVRLLTTGDSATDYKVPGFTIIFTTWSFFCVFVTNFYCSDLISFLTIPRYSPRINSAEDVVKSNLSWSLPLRLPNYDFLNMDLESNRKIMESFFVETNIEIRLQHIFSREHAILVQRIYDDVVIIEGYDLNENIKNIEPLRIMKNCIYSPYIAYGFPHNSPYKDLIDTKLLTIFESGLIQFISETEIGKSYFSFWESVSKEMDLTESNHMESLTINHLNGAFVILSIGYFISLATFLVEILITKSHRIKKSRIR